MAATHTQHIEVSMRYLKIAIPDDLLNSAKEFAKHTNSSVDSITCRLLRQHIGQFAPALLADEYQRDAIASANSTMPDEVPF